MIRNRAQISRSRATWHERAARGIGPVVGAVLVVSAVLTACSSDKEATEIDGKLSRAATAVDVAKTMEAKQFAAPELATAEEKLVRAQRAAREGEYEEADRLTAEILVDINFATAKTDAARIRAQVDQMKEPTETR